ncbi:MAG: hypothetical protein ACYC59_07240 [Anaerolineaceae bacterium]
MQVKLGRYQVGNAWKSQQDIFKLLVSHFRRYHLMEIQDIYKLIYQGVCGSGHILQSSPDEFEAELAREFAAVEANNSQPLWESIHPEGKIVRVNLAVYKNQSQKIERLSTLCLWTAEVSGSPEKNMENISIALNTFYKLCKSRKIPKFTPLEIEKYQKWVEENKFPTVHHSEVYQTNYDPHYRLMHREFLSILV